MTRYRRWEERMALRDHLRDVLRHAADDTPRCFERERQAVCDAANLWALSHPGCRSVSAETVDRCDRHAAGRVDWSDKFPLYVSEAVYGIRWT